MHYRNGREAKNGDKIIFDAWPEIEVYSAPQPLIRSVWDLPAVLGCV